MNLQKCLWTFYISSALLKPQISLPYSATGRTRLSNRCNISDGCGYPRLEDALINENNDFLDWFASVKMACLSVPLFVKIIPRYLYSLTVSSAMSLNLKRVRSLLSLLIMFCQCLFEVH